jgi:cation diffusion facilitator CzcD-associated flavoprotein CzcO
MAGACVDVAIIGGGPFGLMLANELGRRGITAVLFDEKSSTAYSPQANATQARTMEHYRRLGFVDEIRSLGLPEDFPTDIAYFTRYAKYELGRFKLPSSREARARVVDLSARGARLSCHIACRRNTSNASFAVMRKRSPAYPSTTAGGWSPSPITAIMSPLKRSRLWVRRGGRCERNT